MTQTVTPENREPDGVVVSPLLLQVCQLVFNIGFYMVLPFLATHLRDNLALAGAAVGLVLGVRTFSQQGLFIFGGALSDALGARKIIMMGCLIRTAGFLMLGFSHSLPMILLGACLTGVGSALFSPAVSALVAVAGTASEARGGVSRSQLFARLAVWGEGGAVLGPVLGALLLDVNFQTVAMVGAGVFTVMFFVLGRALPADVTSEESHENARWRDVLRNPAFLWFIAAYSTALLSYNQLYFALPFELERAGSGNGALASLFMVVSLLIIALQLPVNRLARQLGPAISLPLGFALFATGFSVIAIFAPLAPPDGWAALVPSFAMVSLLAIAQMIVNPVAMDLIPLFARGKPLGVYYGALASAGGLTVLAGNGLIGGLLDDALTPSEAAAYPWWVLTAIPLASAIALFALLRRPAFNQGSVQIQQQETAS